MFLKLISEHICSEFSHVILLKEMALVCNSVYVDGICLTNIHVNARTQTTTLPLLAFLFPIVHPAAISFPGN